MKKARYEMKVAVSDGVHFLETGILITVTDVNDNRPEFLHGIHNQTFIINRSEFANGNIFVTTILASDKDEPSSPNSKVMPNKILKTGTA